MKNVRPIFMTVYLMLLVGCCWQSFYIGVPVNSKHQNWEGNGMLCLQTWLTQETVKSLSTFDANEVGQVLLVGRMRDKWIERFRAKFYNEVCPEAGLRGPKQIKSKKSYENHRTKYGALLTLEDVTEMPKKWLWISFLGFKYPSGHFLHFRF